jgi:hypothetical protein
LSRSPQVCVLWLSQAACSVVVRQRANRRHPSTY